MHKYNPDKCIACTICLVACPVAKQSQDFLGPRTIGPAHERFRPFGFEEDKSLSLCSNCKNCDIACPHGVPVSTLNMLARADSYKNKSRAAGDRILAHGEALAKSSSLVPSSLKNFMLKNKLVRSVLQTMGISSHATMPNFAKQTFRKQIKKIKQPENPLGKIVFFPGCYMDIYDTQASLDMTQVLNLLGYEVIVPKGLVCCGLPMVANGFIDDARKNAAKNIEVLAPYLREQIPVLTGCPSCALMFKADIPELFPELEFFGTSVHDMQEFVLEKVRACSLGLQLAGSPLSVVYHAPCHLRAQGIGLPGLELLHLVKNLNVVNADAGCCGISGSYGFKNASYAISMQVGAELFQAIKESGATMGVSECGTCRLQMTHGSKLPAVHPLSLVLASMQGRKFVVPE